MLPVAHVAGSIEPLELAPVAVVAAAYSIRARTLALRGTPVPRRRLMCFAAGVALVVAAIVSPLSHMGGELLVAHMAQHLVLADLAALLLVLGLTGPLMQPLLARAGWLRALGNPLVAFPLWAVNLYAWHVPALYQGALASAPLHALEHACFLGFGAVMWLGLLGPLPKPAWFGNVARLVYVVAVRLGAAVLGNVLAWSGSVLYPDYRPGEAEWDISPLADQGAAGVVMMIEGGALTLGLFAWIFFRWARESEERQGLLDLAAERGVALDEARAARAVAAGQGERLRERILTGE
jgi:cytochrome c oxidase assembly factor CtaG